MQSTNLHKTANYLYKEMKRVIIDTVNRERMKKTVEEEGRRLLEVRAAESAGFWYTVNIEGFDALAFCCCPAPRSIPGSSAIDRCPVACLGFYNLNFGHC